MAHLAIGKPSIIWAIALIAQLGPATAQGRRKASGLALGAKVLAELSGGHYLVDTDARGKPIVLGEPGLYISIAHTGSVVAAAASAIGPIGIDVERHNPNRDLDRLARAAFGPAECDAVAIGGLSTFYRIWTIREAISKATGDGMALVTDGLDRVPAIMKDGALVPAANDWLVAHEVIMQDLSLGLALQVALDESRETAQTCSLASLRLE